MSFLSPFPLVLGFVAAAAVVALHLLTTRRPPAMVLPTARFVPVAEARAVARASKPTDLLLLALRMLAVLLIGAAFARPVLDAPGPSVRTVVLLDRSGSVADTADAGAKARTEVGEGGTLQSYGEGSSPGAGSVSAALIAARAAAARIAPGADSVRLVIVSPLLASSFDAATAGLRAGWPGRIDLVRVGAAVDTNRGRPAELLTPLADDPIAPAVATIGGVRGGHAVRIQRGPVTAGDSAWARGGRRVLLAWPARFDEASQVGGVTAFGARATTVVAPLARMDPPLDTSRVVARWNDGAVAASQAVAGDGCIRTVAIGLPLAGDITLRPPFANLLETLTEPCDGLLGAAVPDSALGWLTGAPGSPLAPARQVAASDPSRSSRLPAILLAAALALLAIEQLVRRRAPDAQAATA